MAKLNGWQFIAGLAILTAGTCVVIVTNHESALALVAKIVVWLVGGGSLAALRLHRDAAVAPPAEDQTKKP